MSAQPALRSEHPAASIIKALEDARDLPPDALRAAVGLADEIAPIVIGLVDKAADGVYLLPHEENLHFWGVHALASARHKPLFRPLLRLVTALPTEDLDHLFGAAVTETFAKVFISIFDRDADLLIATCARSDLDGFVRWSLMSALARLTFDGTIPRSAALEFLDRFERENLAASEDAAWQGWTEALWLLGAKEFFPRIRATWDDGRNPEGELDRDYWEEQFAEADVIDINDPARFEDERAVPLDDPVSALSWTAAKPSRAKEKSPYGPDPADIVALQPFEVGWLTGFLRSSKVPANAMTLEQVDGFFMALLAGPEGASLDNKMPAVWNEDFETGAAPSYDSPEQAAYVNALLRRHWTAIRLRLDAGYPHELVLNEGFGDERGRHWASGFVRGVATHLELWERRASEENTGELVSAILTIGAAPDAESERIDQDLRYAFLKILPERLVTLHHAWRGRPDPFPPPPQPKDFGRKVGRNERCPCGSGRKYKFCCGSPEKQPVH